MFSADCSCYQLLGKIQMYMGIGKGFTQTIHESRSLFVTADLTGTES